MSVRLDIIYRNIFYFSYPRPDYDLCHQLNFKASR